MKFGNVEIGSNSQGNSPSLAASIATGYMVPQVNWGGPGFDGYTGLMSAGTPAVPSGAGSADSGGSGAPAAASPAATPAAPAASPTATPATGTGGDGGGQPAGTPAAPATATPGTDPGTNAENIRQLRANYEALKAWDALNKAGLRPDAVQAQIQTYQGMFNEASELAAKLGYTEDSLKAAMESDPVDTLATLRSEYKQKNPGAPNPRELEAMVKKQVQPITEALNRQQTEAAMKRYESEIRRLNSDPQIGFGADVPDEITNAIWDVMDQITPDAVLMEVKNSGQVAGLLPHYNQAKTMILGIINKYNAWMAAKAGQGNGNPNPNPPANAGSPAAPDMSKLTIDDIIGDVSKLPGIKSGAY